MPKTDKSSTTPDSVGPLDGNPDAGLNRREQLALGMLVGPLASKPVDLDEWVEAIETVEPGVRRADLHPSVNQLVAGGYVQRVSEEPAMYRATPAGVDAAIGYGSLEG